jgi:hypothetical protein
MHFTKMETDRKMNAFLHRISRHMAICMAVSLVCFCPAYAAGSRDARAQQAPPAQTSTQHGPSIQIAEKAFDFGEVLEGAEITHVFPVKNTGQASLQITQVRPG